jgi:hypothetical protein
MAGAISVSRLARWGCRSDYGCNPFGGCWHRWRDDRANTSVNAGIHAFKLYTGPDSRSHVLEGTIDQMDRTDVVALHF